MGYLKKKLTEKDLDAMRIALSVRQTKLSSEPICDFCGDSNPVVVYAAVRMSTGEWRSNWRWCACEKCSQAVERNDWAEIKNKLVAWLRTQRSLQDAPRKLLMDAVEMALSDFILYAEEDL